MTPIGESGVGEDLRKDPSSTSIYYTIKDARSRARAAERAIAMQGDLATEVPNWRPVLDLAPLALAGRSKDLEITAYLIEALVREHGFKGLASGFKLALSLVKAFGKKLYPQPDEDGVETQLAPLSGLNGAGSEGTLIQPINNIPLTGRSSGASYGEAAHRQASDLSRLAEEQRDRRVADGAVTVEMFQAAIADSDTEELRTIFKDIKACLEEHSQLTSVLDELYGADSPPSSSIRSALEACRDTLLTVARDRVVVVEVDVVPEAAAPVADAEATDPVAGGTLPSARGGVTPLKNRDDAFKEILRIAKYFQTAEPQSPISYALEQVVRWGRMPLPALVHEMISKQLITDTSGIGQFFKFVGIVADGDPKP